MVGLAAAPVDSRLRGCSLPAGAVAFVEDGLAELLLELLELCEVEALSLAAPPHAASVALKQTAVNAAIRGPRCICIVSPYGGTANVGYVRRATVETAAGNLIEDFRAPIGRAPTAANLRTAADKSGVRAPRRQRRACPPSR